MVFVWGRYKVRALARNRFKSFFLEYPKIQEPLYLRKESVEVKESHSEPRKATFPFSLSASKENKLTDSTPKISSAHATIPKFEQVDTAGAFVLYRQFSLLAQVGSIAICRTTNSLNQLLVSQPCGGYSILGTYGVGSMRKYSEVKISFSSALHKK